MLMYFYALLIILLIQMIAIVAEIKQRNYSLRDFIDSGEILTLMDGQIPEDVIYDLAGNSKLVTIDELTGEYHTFKVYKDGDQIPYVKDPNTGYKYLVKSSITNAEIDIYRIFEDKNGIPIVADWTDMTINEIKLNKYGEVVLVPVS